MNGFPAFEEFFQALWDKEPFPWQTMLAERVAAGQWPDAIDLPTASGKTACLDIAVYVLAAQASKPLAERTAPRRIWFVVDRRIVVDEAFERAERIAAKLESSTSPALRAVADRLLALRELPRRERPLAVGRLRGGVLRDDRWARIPSQAAIITSTVDQLGSRLLFRGYGHSALVAPIYAGLAANDSLILLDEAHCAVPFLQTLRAVKRFRSDRWAELPNPTPYLVAVLSATPPGEDEEEKPAVFPKDEEERTRALDHQKLQERLTASKRAGLCQVVGEGELAAEMAEAAQSLAKSGATRIGVIVNRVGRAVEIANRIRAEANSAFDVRLLTGRIRPVERDQLVGPGTALHRQLRAVEPDPLKRPLILVSTQCLEVGADFSFDALVTECASLDALRQRFGRLARLGTPETADAFIFAAESTLKQSDPIYGDALKATWEFLWNNATPIPNAQRRIASEKRVIDFGFEALRRRLPADVAELRPLLAPAADAPVLLPAHVDLLSQTAPCPHPDPDVSLFLHGKGRTTAEVRVVWRCDLDPRHTDQWAEIVSLCRPVAGEMLSVPLWRLRQWLQDRKSADLAGDVEGGPVDIGEETASGETAGGAFLIWRGRDHSEVLRDPNRITPDSVVVLPTPDELTEAEALGQVLGWQGVGPYNLDLWEVAWKQTGRPRALRVHRACLDRWASTCPPLDDLLRLTEAGEWSADELRNALAAVGDWQPEDPDGEPLPDWLRDLFEAVSDFRIRDLAEHPGGGLILNARPSATIPNEPDLFADDEDAPSDAPERINLQAHSVQVADIAAKLTRACLGSQAEECLIVRAALWHDAGKLDPRFQELLRGGAPAADDTPLAKSPDMPRSPVQAKAVAQAAELPQTFRHEMFSAQLAERLAAADCSLDDRDLFLHLIASHHGLARPFAPVCMDANPPAVRGKLAGVTIALNTEERRQLIPPHRLDAGVIDRFWQLTRRFGWWGLAYREAVLRLADWYASTHPRTPDMNVATSARTHRQAVESGLRGRNSFVSDSPDSLELRAIDGSNPLGFLAALGTLRLVTRCHPKSGYRLHWKTDRGAWRPVLSAMTRLDSESGRSQLLLQLAEQGVKLADMFPTCLLAGDGQDQEERDQNDRLVFQVGIYRRFCLTASPTSAEYAAAWASEVAIQPGNKKLPVAKRTRLDFTAGQQKFIAMLRELKNTITADDLRYTLFDGWRYTANAQSMRWDPLDEKRQYALQAVDPTNSQNNPPVADQGANFLAVEALPFFPMVPDKEANQPGFRRQADRWSFLWPIWERPLGLKGVQSLLTLPLDDLSAWPTSYRRALGIAGVFRATIVQPSGKYRCFTPATALV